MRADSIGVVIVCTNQPHRLAACVQAILDQADLAAEIVIVDATGTDQGRRIARQFIPQGVRCLTVPPQPNQAALRAGFDVTHAPLVCYLDAETPPAPDHLARALSMFRTRRHLDLVTRNRTTHAAGEFHAGDVVRRHLVDREIEPAAVAALVDHPPPPPPVSRPAGTHQAPVAVLIPCHNYGRFLAECLDSVLSQEGAPQEIVIVDDSSTDHTPDVAARYASRGVRYIRIEARSVWHARKTGFDATTAPYLCFLDADDTLPPDYLARGLTCFDTPRVGIVTTNLQMFGARSDLKAYPECNLEQRNWIHAGSIAKREALESANVFRRPEPVRACHADWIMWREVLRAGWHARRSPALYYYRQHAESMMSQRPAQPDYYELASLAQETVTLILPLSGRREWWPRLRNWATRQAWPLDQLEVIVTDTGDATFSATVREWLAQLPVRGTTYLHLDQTHGLADEERVDRQEIQNAVNRIVPQIYRQAIDRAATEYLLLVEDDMLPPDDALPRLMQSMSANTAAVSGCYRSRYSGAWIVWPNTHDRKTGVERVEGTGFGCFLVRRSVLQQIILRHGGPKRWFDHQFGADAAALGFQVLMDWAVGCEHQELSPGPPPE